MSPSSSSSVSNTTLCIVYFNVFLYATCFQLQRPIEPFLVEKLGLSGGGSSADAQGTYMQLQSFFSILQVIGSLFIGILIDRIGSRGGFILCFGASALSYALLAYATSIELLFLSKIPTVFQAAFLCAQAAVADTTTEGSDRVAALGRLTVCYTIGSIVGPGLGGMIGATGDYYVGAKGAVVGSLLSIVLCFFMKAPVRNDTKKEDTATSDSSLNTPHREKFPHNVLSVIKAVWLLLGTKLISGISNSIASFAFPLILKDIYGLQESGLGLSMSVMSAFNAFVNSFLLSPISQYFNENLMDLIKSCSFWMFVFYGVQFFFARTTFAPPLELLNGYYPFITTCIVLSMYQYILATVITSESTTRVQQESKGTLIGLEHSLFALARIFTPQIGLTVLTWGGVAGISGVCGSIFFGTYAAWVFLSKRSNLFVKDHGEKKES